MSLNNVLRKKQLHFQSFSLTMKLDYLHDLKIMFQCLLHLNMYDWILISCLNWKLQLFMCLWIIKWIFNHLIHHISLSVITEYWIQNIHTIVFFGFIHDKSQVDYYEESNTLFYIICTLCISSLPHVINTDAAQHKQLQNSIWSITSDHANVWVYIWVLFKSNIPVPLKFMLILLWYLNLLWV